MKHVSVVDVEEANVTAFHLTGGMEGESADAMYIVFNPNKEAKEIMLPEGKWHICINGEEAGVTSLGTVKDSVTVDPISALVLVQGEVETTKDNSVLALFLAVGGGAILGSAMKKKKAPVGKMPKFRKF